MNVHRRNKIDETWTIYNPINEWVYLVAELGYIGKGGQSNNFKIWELSVAYLFSFVSGLGFYFSGFILVFDDLIMLPILHILDDRVYRQWGACDDSWILKSTLLAFQKCSYPWEVTVFVDNGAHVITHINLEIY